MTVPDLDQEIREIKSRISAVQTAKVRAEIERDHASAAIVRAKARLVAEFGVDTVEAARERISTLEAELAQRIAEVAEALERSA